MDVTTEDVALDILETVPAVIRVIRAEMRRHRQLGLSVPQFRTLAYLRSQPGASLNSLAEHLGLTPASTSKLVDGLVERNLIARSESSKDRRRVMLTLLPSGLSVWETAFTLTQAAIASRLSGLTGAERGTLKSAMQILCPLFAEAE